MKYQPVKLENRPTSPGDGIEMKDLAVSNHGQLQGRDVEALTPTTSPSNQINGTVEVSTPPRKGDAGLLIGGITYLAVTIIVDAIALTDAKPKERTGYRIAAIVMTVLPFLLICLVCCRILAGLRG